MTNASAGIQQHAKRMLLLVCFIWGVEFVLIDMAVALLPVHTFNTLRFALAAACFLPFLIGSNKASKTPYSPRLLSAGALLGFILFVGFYAQTEGLRFTSVANAGFITGLNVPLVPVLGLLLFKTPVPRIIWFAVLLATLGLYLLTIGDKLTFNEGDTLVLICAFAFALHILLTEQFVKNLPVIPLSIVQLIAVALYSSIALLISPEPAFYHPNEQAVSWSQALLNPIIVAAILVAGILGTAFALWAQTTSQRNLPAHQVALIFAAEPLFAYLTAWYFQGEHLGHIGLAGASLIIVSMLAANRTNTQAH